MSLFKRFSLKKTAGFVISAFLMALLVYFVYKTGLFSLSSEEKVSEFLAEFGAAAPLIFMLLQFLQVLVAVLPGNASSFVGGMLFGHVWGTVMSFVSIISGSQFLFWFGRNYGRKLVAKLIEQDTIDKYAPKLSGKKAANALLVIFWVPMLPDDAVCLLAGITNSAISYKQFLYLAIIGRVPSIIINNAIGAGLHSGYIVWIIGATVFIYAVALALYNFAYLKKNQKPIDNGNKENGEE
ncbi:MAG: VTT domain-containing protein [Eubacteriaceae bacterium]|nr:VTT domain-containing protein [Eubacteriaceae bacterium]